MRIFFFGFSLWIKEAMNRKEDYDSYEIEEPSDEEGACSRYTAFGTCVRLTTVKPAMCVDSVHMDRGPSYISGTQL